MLTNDEIEKIVVKNDALVRYVASRYVNLGIEFEDLCSIGKLALVRAAKAYDETKNVKFSTFAVVVIRRDIIKEIRKVLKANEEKPTVISLDENITWKNDESKIKVGDLVGDEKQNVEVCVENMDQISHALTFLLNQAPEKESLVFLMYMCEMSASEISSVLSSISAPKVGKILQKWYKLIWHYTGRYDFSKVREWIIKTDGCSYEICVQNNKKLCNAMLKVADECKLKAINENDSVRISVLGDERIFVVLVKILKEYKEYKGKNWDM